MKTASVARLLGRSPAAGGCRGLALVAAAGIALGAVPVLAPGAFAAVRGDVPSAVDVATACRTSAEGQPVALGEGDDGGQVCLREGQTVTVSLAVDPRESPTGAWTPVTASGDALTAVPSPGPAPAGTTLAVFRADRTGVAVLSSALHPCTAPGEGQVCPMALRSWRATVVVLGRTGGKGR